MADLRKRAGAAIRAAVGSQARPVALILLAFVVVAVVVVTFGHDWSQSQATMVGGTAVLAAALIAFRQGTLGRQEQARDRAQAERAASEAHDREVRRELHERFARLAELLGSEAGSTSAAAVSGLARLADDWAARGDLADRDVCIEAVCSVLRQKREVNPVAHATALRELRQHRSISGSWGATFWHPAQRDPDNHGWEVARWAGARLDLCGADLAGAVLIGVDLTEAEMIGADLYGANLQGANIRGAHLQDADLRKAQFGNKWDPETGIAVLRGATVDGAKFDSDEV